MILVWEQTAQFYFYVKVSEMPSNWIKLKTLVFRLRVDRNPLEKEAFHKRCTDVVTIITWFPCPSFSQTQIQNDKRFLRFSFSGSGVVWTEDIWCVFRLKPPFSNSSGAIQAQNSKVYGHSMKQRLSPLPTRYSRRISKHSGLAGSWVRCSKIWEQKNGKTKNSRFPFRLIFKLGSVSCR